MIQIPSGIWNLNSNLRLVEFQIPAWFWCTSKPPVIVYAVHMRLLVSDILYMPCILYMPYISDILYMPYISDIPYFENLKKVHARTRTSSTPNHIWNLEFRIRIWNLEFEFDFGSSPAASISYHFRCASVHVRCVFKAYTSSCKLTPRGFSLITHDYFHSKL